MPPALLRILRDYLGRLRSFHTNARLYLVSVILTGASLGIFRLLFNFYILSLGYNEALLGQLITVSNASALLLSLPLGYAIDGLGYKPALMARTVLLGLSVGAMSLWPSVSMFYAMNILIGIVQSISRVAQAPFLMANSGSHERTYLFSFSAGLRMGSVFLGNWLGGYLPIWMGLFRHVESTSSTAYGQALLAVSLLALLGVIPLIPLRPAIISKGQPAQEKFSPLRLFRQHPRLLAKLLAPTMMISLGAGLFVPFMNVFFRNIHHLSDPAIGVLFAWGSLAMGVGLMIAPPIADRLGKVKLVALTQGASIPFMALLGFAPFFPLSAAAYYARMVLMNMSSPIYDTFIMEQVPADSRATVASLNSMTWSFGRTFSPTISGWVQVQYGFGPVFGGAIVLYAVAVSLYGFFFLGLKNKMKHFRTSGI